MGPLRRKVRRDMWQERWRFAAIIVIMAIGLAVFVGASDSYRNLDGSFDRAYAAQRLPDAILSGPGAAAASSAAAALPGHPLVELRHVADVGLRLDGHAVYGRAIGVPDSVSLLDIRSGTLPGPGQVLLEQHIADHFHLGPGSAVELLEPHGWQRVTVAGTALSPEYLWPARSAQDVLSTPEDFGVVFIADPTVQHDLADPVAQLALYARDREQAAALTASAGTLARSAGLQFMPRDQQASFHTLNDDVVQFGTLARLLPWLFLAAAVLGTYVLLSRIVAAQRALIGTLVANGLSAAAVRRHYLSYGVACAAVGIPPGLLGGYALGRWITAQFTQAISLPMDVSSAHPPTYLAGAIAAVAVAVLAALAPAAAAARMRPAEGMRVAPPMDGGRRSLLERGLPVLGRLPARWRMVLRAISRNRRRSAFTALGVAVAVVLVMVFAGMRDTLPGIVDRQFGQIERQDGEVVVAGRADAVLVALRSDPAVSAAEPYRSYGVTVSHADHRYDTMVIGLSPHSHMHVFPAESGSDQLTGDGVLLGVGLRDMLSVTLGDRIELVVSPSGRRLRERVAGFVDEPFSPVVYLAANRLTADAGPLPVDGIFVKLKAGTDERAFGERASAIPAVAAYRSTRSLAATMRRAFSLYDTLVGVMFVFAAVMAAAMLYNAMSANIAERLGELGALHAEGMAGTTLFRLIATESLGLALIALPFGLLGGVALADRLLATYHSLGYHLRLEMQPWTPVAVATGVLIAAALAQLPVLRQIRRLDLARIVKQRAS